MRSQDCALHYSASRGKNEPQSERTFNEEFSRALGDAGWVGGTTREDTRVLNQHFPDRQHELLAFTQHLQHLSVTTTTLSRITQPGNADIQFIKSWYLPVRNLVPLLLLPLPFNGLFSRTTLVSWIKLLLGWTAPPRRCPSNPEVVRSMLDQSFLVVPGDVGQRLRNSPPAPLARRNQSATPSREGGHLPPSRTHPTQCLCIPGSQVHASEKHQKHGPDFQVYAQTGKSGLCF